VRGVRAEGDKVGHRTRLQTLKVQPVLVKSGIVPRHAPERGSLKLIGDTMSSLPLFAR
jgi:hypothetical protein